MARNTRRPLAIALGALATTTLGGCYYGDVHGSSYASAGYACRDTYYDYDPYAYDDGYGYDCYDSSDYGGGFVQIGFGGGWYDDYYYPGYGMWMFDSYRNRYPLRGQYLNYWGGRRAWWKHHGNRGGQHGQRPTRPGRPDVTRPEPGRPDGGKRNWADHVRDQNAAERPSGQNRNWTGRGTGSETASPGNRPGWNRPDGARPRATGERRDRPAAQRPDPGTATGAPAARPAPATRPAQPERNRNWGDQMRGNRPETARPSAGGAAPATRPVTRAAPAAPVARPAPAPRPAPVIRSAPAPRNISGDATKATVDE